MGSEIGACVCSAYWGTKKDRYYTLLTHEGDCLIYKRVLKDVAVFLYLFTNGQ